MKQYLGSSRKVILLISNLCVTPMTSEDSVRFYEEVMIAHHLNVSLMTTFQNYSDNVKKQLQKKFF